LTIEHGDEPVGVDLIAAGQRQFGLISGEQVIAARAGGRPVVSVYEWFQQYPVGIVYPEDAGISAVSDLAGRNVGIPGRFGASYSGLVALLTASGMAESDIALEEIGFNAPEVFCLGGVEASVVYINNEPIQIQHRADQGECAGISSVSVFPVSAAVDMVSNGVVTNEQTIAEQPELVSAMVAGFDAGLASVIRNPAEAFLISANYVDNLLTDPALRGVLETEAEERDAMLEMMPGADADEITAQNAAMLARLQQQFPADALTQIEVLLATIELWRADRLGLADEASWAATQDILIQMGFVQEAVDVTAAFTNDYLPPAE
jgi:NitT/TauT family transport system substrate-binding protein